MASQLRRLLGVSEELLQSYHALVNEIVPGPQSTSYFAPPMLVFVALMIPPDVLSHTQLRLLFMPPILACSVHSWLAMGSVDVLSTDLICWSSFLLLFRDVRADFKRVWNFGTSPSSSPLEQSTSSPQKAKDLSTASTSTAPHRLLLEPYPVGLWPRLVWVFNLFCSRPLNSWHTNSASHDAHLAHPWPPPTRLQFMRLYVRRVAPVLLGFLPLSLHLARDDPYFSDPAVSVLAPYPTGPSTSLTASFLRAVLPKVLLRPLTLAAYTYGLLILMWHIPMPGVLLTNWALGIPPDTWSPHTLKPLFGPFTAVLDLGIRGFWGVWWHQQYRHMCSEPGRVLGKILGCGKKATYVLVSFSAFALSGLIHVGLVPPRPRWSRVEATELRWGIGGFFMVQPLGIAVEMGVVEPVLGVVQRVLGGKEGWSRGVVRALRFAWVCVFMALAMQLLVTPYSELRYWKLWPPPFVPEGVRGLLAGDWIP